MASIGILTDSTADLRPAVQERFGLGMVPLIVNWDGQTFRDKIDLTTADFYQRLPTSKTLPKTGSPSAAAVEAALPDAPATNHALIRADLAAKLSQPHHRARATARAR